MSLQGWNESLVVGGVDGPALSAAAAASCIPTPSLITLPNNFWVPKKKVTIRMAGRISCAVTTPGTARFDVRLGGTVVFDTGALNLNIVAKTNVPWWLEIDLTCRAEGSGTAANIMGQALFQSEAIVGSPLPSAGGNGSLLAPVATPAVGSGFNSTSALTLDVFFTQTVATGSLTVHQYEVIARN